MKQGWEIRKLGEVCENVSNINWKTISLDTKFPYIDLSAVDIDNSNIDDFEYINKDNAPSRAKQIVNTGDVIFATTRPLLKRVCVITKSFNNAIASTGFCVLRPKGKVVSKWIYYILKSDSFYIYIEPLQKGISYPAVSDNEVKNFSIPVPPLAEQEHIVAELDLLSGIIEKQKQQLKEYDTLAQSIFYTMFGDIECNKGYEIKTLVEICELITDGTHQTPIYTDDYINGYKFLSAKDVVEGIINWDNIKYIPKELHETLYARLAPRRGDLLLCKNGTTGICALVETDEIFDIYVSLALLRLHNNICAKYMLYAINSKGTKRQFDDSLKGVGVPNLHLSEIRKTLIIFPPLSLQQEFAEKIEAIEKQKELVKQSLAEAETLFNSRMDYYFN